MPSAISPLRCPHRMAHSPGNWLTALLVSLVWITTANASLNGQELDYRFVEPAGHMQLWPVEEADVSFSPLPSVPKKPQKVAVRWRSNFSATDEQQEPNQAVQLPEPTPQDADGKVEVLVVPKPAEVDALANQPSSQPRACYQAPPLSTMSVSIALPAGKLPTDAAAHCALQHPPTSDARLTGAWATSEVHWSATCLRHRPLYFEEINAERYGYTVSNFFQPLFSAGRFFATIPALPYKMAVDRPRDCVYTLGHYRPGNCAPRRHNRLPWQLTASVVETGFIAGLILLIP